jgi:hypothetical protein
MRASGIVTELAHGKQESQLRADYDGLITWRMPLFSAGPAAIEISNVPNFVYGDSCVSGDDKYVLAQFRHDASMAWVGELRAFLVKDEAGYTYLP